MPTYTKKNARVETLTIVTTFDSADVAVAVNCSATLRTRIVNDSNSAESADLPNKNLDFNLLGSPVSTTNYTAAGKTVNGVQFAALARQIVLDEATRQGI